MILSEFFSYLKCRILLSGILIIAALSKYNANYICLTFTFVTFFMNIFSRKEVPLKKLDKAPELESFSTTMKSYICMPKCLRFLSMFIVFLWTSLTGMWVWYTDIYAETVGVADKDSLNETEYRLRYDEATQQGALVLLGYPIGALVFSLIFTTFNLFNRWSKKIIVQAFNLSLLAGYLTIKFYPSKALFGVFAVLMGFSSLIINSVPFLLIDKYRSREGYPTNRGLANDNSVCTLSGDN